MAEKDPQWIILEANGRNVGPDSSLCAVIVGAYAGIAAPFQSLERYESCKAEECKNYQNVADFNRQRYHLP